MIVIEHLVEQGDLESQSIDGLKRGSGVEMEQLNVHTQCVYK